MFPFASSFFNPSFFPFISPTLDKHFVLYFSFIYSFIFIVLHVWGCASSSSLFLSPLSLLSFFLSPCRRPPSYSIRLVHSISFRLGSSHGMQSTYVNYYIYYVYEIRMPHSCWFFSPHTHANETVMCARIRRGRVKRMCDFYYASYTIIHMHGVLVFIQNSMYSTFSDFHLEFYLCTGEKVTKKSSFIFTIILYLCVQRAIRRFRNQSRERISRDCVDLCMPSYYIFCFGVFFFSLRRCHLLLLLLAHFIQIIKLFIYTYEIGLGWHIKILSYEFEFQSNLFLHYIRIRWGPDEEKKRQSFHENIPWKPIMEKIKGKLWYGFPNGIRRWSCHASKSRRRTNSAFVNQLQPSLFAGIATIRVWMIHDISNEMIFAKINLIFHGRYTYELHIINLNHSGISGWQIVKTLTRCYFHEIKTQCC